MTALTTAPAPDITAEGEPERFIRAVPETPAGWAESAA